MVTYSEYLEKFRNAQMEGRLPENAEPDSEEDFRFFNTPLKETPSLAEDVPFRLSYKNIYLTLRKKFEKLDNKDALVELDKIYNETAEKLNLL